MAGDSRRGALTIGFVLLFVVTPAMGAIWWYFRPDLNLRYRLSESKEFTINHMLGNCMKYAVYFKEEDQLDCRSGINEILVEVRYGPAGIPYLTHHCESAPAIITQAGLHELEFVRPTGNTNGPAGETLKIKAMAQFYVSNPMAPVESGNMIRFLSQYLTMWVVDLCEVERQVYITEVARLVGLGCGTSGFFLCVIGGVSHLCRLVRKDPEKSRRPKYNNQHSGVAYMRDQKGGIVEVRKVLTKVGTKQYLACRPDGEILGVMTQGGIVSLKKTKTQQTAALSASKTLDLDRHGKPHGVSTDRLDVKAARSTPRGVSTDGMSAKAKEERPRSGTDDLDADAKRQAFNAARSGSFDVNTKRSKLRQESSCSLEARSRKEKIPSAVPCGSSTGKLARSPSRLPPSSSAAPHQAASAKSKSRALDHAGCANTRHPYFKQSIAGRSVQTSPASTKKSRPKELSRIASSASLDVKELRPVSPSAPKKSRARPAQGDKVDDEQRSESPDRHAAQDAMNAMNASTETRDPTELTGPRDPSEASVAQEDEAEAFTSAAAHQLATRSVQAFTKKSKKREIGSMPAPKPSARERWMTPWGETVGAGVGGVSQNAVAGEDPWGTHLTKASRQGTASAALPVAIAPPSDKATE